MKLNALNLPICNMKTLETIKTFVSNCMEMNPDKGMLSAIKEADEMYEIGLLPIEIEEMHKYLSNLN